MEKSRLSDREKVKDPDLHSELVPVTDAGNRGVLQRFFRTETSGKKMVYLMNPVLAF